MTLPAGSRFGIYEIVSPLGSGGMGEVYRARDPRLGRDVAIKILPSGFADDQTRLARFSREGRVLASLNHPNIATLFGIEEAGREIGLILELIEGESLDVRLSRGPVPLHDALKIAQQVADALSAAHAQGIVHRDLKPANVRLTRSGVAKVLDFGLAKALDDRSADQSDDGDARTSAVTIAETTTPGMIVGTLAYMSPEQARGQPVDKQTDIWALGLLLYEMLTGQRAFQAATATDLLASIVSTEPDWEGLPATTPSAVRRLLRRCLAKDLRARLQDAGDIRLAIEDIQTAPDTAERMPAARARFLAPAAAALITAFGLAALALAVVFLRRPPTMPEVRFETLGGVDITSNATVAISPDGLQLAIAPTFEQETPLWLRPVDSLGGRSLPGTEGAFLPFWSPDGRSIGFFAHRKLQRVDLESGVTTVVADAAVGRGGAWASDGTILFAPMVSGPLRRVSAAGGEVTMATTLLEGQNDHRAPQFLPGETHFLYYARGMADVRGVFVARRDGQETKRLLDADAPAVLASSRRLLFIRGRTLFAQEFDPDRLELKGPAVAVAEPVALNLGVSLATLAASPAGTVAYGVAHEGRYQFAWFDREGKKLSSVGPDDIAGGNPAISPDGQSVAFNRVTAGNWDIFTLDLRREALTRITSEPTLDFSPIWTRDGRSLVFQSTRGPTLPADLFVKSADGSGQERLLLSSPLPKGPTDISPDGNILLFESGDPSTLNDIWMLSMSGSPEPRPVVQTRFAEREGQFSPDGHWIAYSSNESGQFEVYAQPFPGPGRRISVSVGGGNQLRWGRRGTELFYIDPRGRLTAVPVTIQSNQSIDIGKPVPLFATPFGFSSQGPRAGYVVSDDGQRFLLAASTETRAPASIVVMLNWRGNP